MYMYKIFNLYPTAPAKACINKKSLYSETDPAVTCVCFLSYQSNLPI